MTLTEIDDGTRVFIDANIFIYHFAGASAECRDLLSRCERGNVQGCTSTGVLLEVSHRLMAMEAVSRGIIKPKNPAAKLKKNPEKVKKLSVYFTQLTGIMEWNIEILPLLPEHLIKSQIYRQQYGLMTNDSLIPVSMDVAGTACLASADQHFTSLPRLQLHAPSDL